MYLYQEAVTAIPTYTDMIAHTFHTKFWDSITSAITVSQTVGMLRQKETCNAADASHWQTRGKKDKKNPHRHFSFFLSFPLFFFLIYFSALPPYEDTNLCCSSSPFPSGTFLPIIAFKLYFAKLSLSHHFYESDTSLLIPNIFWKFQESHHVLFLFLDLIHLM